MLSAYTSLISFCLHDSDALAVNFEQVTISAILFTVLLHVCNIYTIGAILFAYFQYIRCYFEQGIFRIIHFLCCFLTRYWLVPYQQHISAVTDVVYLHTMCWLLSLNRSFFRFHYLWHYLLIRHIDLFSVSYTVTLEYSSSLTLVQWLLTWNKSLFQ